METLQRLHNRGSVSTGYNIDNSCKFEEDNSEYLERATGGGNGSTTQHTISVWVKRTELAKASFILGFANIGRLRFESDDKIEYQFRSGRKIETNRLFRDISAWYHIVVVADSTLATSTDRMKLYINGVRETDLLTYVAQDQNQGSPAWGVYNTYNYRIGYSGNANENFNGYIAEAYYINGQTLDPTDFGEFDEDTGIWKPKEFTGTFGSLDNYLNFSNSSNLGEDANGGTDLSSNNITSADQATDTPTNNFAVANILTSLGGFLVPSEGATKGVLSTAGPGNNVGGVSLVSTLAPSSGKWYFEAQNTNSGDVYLYIGAADTGSIAYIDGYVFGGQNGTLPSIAWRGGGAYDNSAKVYTNNVATGSSVNWETEVVGVALDLDNNKIYFHKSGTWINSGDPANGTDNGGQYDLPTAEDGQWYLGVSAYNLATWLLNFGGYTTMSISSAASDANGYGTFEYAPPSGYYALCGKNLAEFGGTA